MKKMIMGFVAAVVVTSLLSACSGSGTGGSSQEQTGTGVKQGGSDAPTLNVAVVTHERIFDTLKQNFEASHPGFTVNIREYYTAMADKTAEGSAAQIQRDLDKYVSTVTTEMASGRGPDVLVTNYLPYKKYADKNMLADLSKLMAEDASFDSSQYFTNVFDAMKYKDRLYAIPTSVQFTNLWIGDQSLLTGAQINDDSWSWHDFAGAAKPLVPDGGSALSGTTPGSLLQTMLNPGIEQFVDYEHKKASFDSPEFAGLLNEAKSMIDDGTISGAAQSAAGGKGKGMELLMPYGFRSLTDFITMPSLIFSGHGAVYRAPSLTPNQGYAFRSNLTLSINEKSSHKKEAWELLKTALSEQVQADGGTGGMRGIPVHKGAFDQMLEALKDPQYLAQSSANMLGAGKKLNIQPATQEQLDKIKSYMTDIHSVQETDNKIFDLVVSESAPLFSGQKSAEEVARSIQNKVKTYLNE